MARRSERSLADSVLNHANAAVPRSLSVATHRITTMRKEGVPPFPPQLPPDCELDSSAASREFLMSKGRLATA